MTAIASAENPRFKALLKLLHSARERKKQGLSVLDGVHLVAAYRDHVGLPVQVVVSRAALERQEIAKLVSSLAPLAPLTMNDALFAQLSSVATPTGIVAVVRTPRPLQPPAELGPCVLLEDIQDPGNLGSVLRSAAAAGMRAVCLSPHCVHSWSPRVLRAGMGAHFALQIYEQVDLVALARNFKGRVVATCRDARHTVFAADLTGHVALAFGNEGSGISRELLAAAHQRVTIPMPGPMESLNVAAAAAVCLFERVRQATVTGRVQ